MSFWNDKVPSKPLLDTGWVGDTMNFLGDNAGAIVPSLGPITSGFNALNTFVNHRPSQDTRGNSLIERTTMGGLDFGWGMIPHPVTLLDNLTGGSNIGLIKALTNIGMFQGNDEHRERFSDATTHNTYGPVVGMLGLTGDVLGNLGGMLVDKVWGDDTGPGFDSQRLYERTSTLGDSFLNSGNPLIKGFANLGNELGGGIYDLVDKVGGLFGGDDDQKKDPFEPEYGWWQHQTHLEPRKQQPLDELQMVPDKPKGPSPESPESLFDFW